MHPRPPVPPHLSLQFQPRPLPHHLPHRSSPPNPYAPGPCVPALLISVLSFPSPCLCVPCFSIPYWLLPAFPFLSFRSLLPCSLVLRFPRAARSSGEALGATGAGPQGPGVAQNVRAARHTSTGSHPPATGYKLPARIRAHTTAPACKNTPKHAPICAFRAAYLQIGTLKRNYLQTSRAIRNLRGCQLQLIRHLARYMPRKIATSQGYI